MPFIFYVSPAYDGEDVVKWPTENFKLDELQVIQRFLDELKAHGKDTILDEIWIENSEVILEDKPMLNLPVGISVESIELPPKDFAKYDLTVTERFLDGLNKSLPKTIVLKPLL